MPYRSNTSKFQRLTQHRPYDADKDCRSKEEEQAKGWGHHRETSRPQHCDSSKTQQNTGCSFTHRFVPLSVFSPLSAQEKGPRGAGGLELCALNSGPPSLVRVNGKRYGLPDAFGAFFYFQYRSVSGEKTTRLQKSFQTRAEFLCVDAFDAELFLRTRRAAEMYDGFAVDV